MAKKKTKPKPPTPKGYLPVQLNVWRTGCNDRVRYQPKGSDWKNCGKLNVARQYAENHGYKGMKIELV